MITTPVTLWQRSILVALLIAGAAVTSFAVPPGQVLKASNLAPLAGQCCFSFNEAVAATEPNKPVPVVVTWSGLTGNTFGDHFVGLMVNGGACQFYGPRSIQAQGPDQLNALFVWVVLPGDGLHAGVNTFTLCGGGAGVFPDESFNILDNSLAVRLSK